MGPLARTVRDCARVLGVIAGADENDASTSAEPVPDYEATIEQSLRGVRVGIPQGYFDEDLDPGVAAAIEAAHPVFKGLGAKLVPVPMPALLDTVSAIHPLVMKCEGAANHLPWKRAQDEHYSDEVGKRLQAGFFIPATDYINALQYRAHALRTFADAVFGACDALLTPVLPMPTPTLADTAYRDGPAYLNMVVGLTRNTRVVNYLGLPALSVTCGFTACGMPTSFQAHRAALRRGSAVPPRPSVPARDRLAPALAHCAPGLRPGTESAAEAGCGGARSTGPAGGAQRSALSSVSSTSCRFSGSC